MYKIFINISNKVTISFYVRQKCITIITLYLNKGVRWMLNHKYVIR